MTPPSLFSLSDTTGHGIFLCYYTGVPLAIIHIDWSCIFRLEESSKTFAEQSAPSGGGMNVFGIGKDGLARAIIKFLTPPMPAPLTVCFQFPGAFLTHRYVVAMMKSLLMGKEGCGVVSVQYVDRNVALGTRNLENRWLITVTTQQAKDELITQGISIVNRKIAIRPYDEVLSEEYQEFQEFLDHQRKMGLKHSLDTRDNGGEGDPDVDNDGDMEGTLDRAVGGDGEPINSMKEVPLPPAHPVYNSDDSDKE